MKEDLKLEVYRSDDKYVARIVDKVIGLSYRQGIGDTEGEALEALHKSLKYHVIKAKNYLRFFEDEIEVMRIQEYVEEKNIARNLHSI